MTRYGVPIPAITAAEIDAAHSRYQEAAGALAIAKAMHHSELTLLVLTAEVRQFQWDALRFGCRGRCLMTGECDCGGMACPSAYASHTPDGEYVCHCSTCKQ